mgnify:CR=1 FL=1
MIPIIGISAQIKGKRIQRILLKNGYSVAEKTYFLLPQLKVDYFILQF